MGRSNAEARVSQMDDSELLKPLIVRGPGSEAPRSLRKAGKKREARASTMVSERVYVALQRGGAVRSTLEVEDLMLFVSQVHPLKLFGSFVRRTLCEQAQLVQFQTGDVICTEGERCDTYFVILSGSAEVYRTDPSLRARAERDERARKQRRRARRAEREQEREQRESAAAPLASTSATGRGASGAEASASAPAAGEAIVAATESCRAPAPAPEAARPPPLSLDEMLTDEKSAGDGSDDEEDDEDEDEDEDEEGAEGAAGDLGEAGVPGDSPIYSPSARQEGSRSRPLTRT